ncbi:MAG: cell division protein FtsZ [Bacteroidetes bacterium]|nr:cell division protein FtsZ [Bacteroidota bacterium]MBS1972904.1 cell division protein FtsZ [Bacteroidota bacterium]
MIHFDLPKEKSSIIKVIGVGGGGSNAVNYMYSQSIEGVNFIICNTDAQALAQSRIPNKIQLGPHLTQGLGAGANPDIGRQATEESLEEIKKILEVNTKMAFITAGMGGGTGTGGGPIIAKICKDLGILTVGIITTPFSYEGKKRQLQAEEGIYAMKQYVDTLLVISNDKLRHQFGNLKMKEAFAKADNVLATAAKCITDVINSTGQINVDFADVCTVMRNGGVAILGSAATEGEDRAHRAIEEALTSPLLNDNDIRGAKWILININSAEDEHEFTMDEVEIIQDHLISRAGEHTDVILGLGYDNSLGAKIGITLIATGFEYKDPFPKTETVKSEPKKEDRIVMPLVLPEENVKTEQGPVLPLATQIEKPVPEQHAFVAPEALPEELQPKLKEEKTEQHMPMIFFAEDGDSKITVDKKKEKNEVEKTVEWLNSQNLIATDNEKNLVAKTLPGTPATAISAGYLARPKNIYAEEPRPEKQSSPEHIPVKEPISGTTANNPFMEEDPSPDMQLVFKDIPAADAPLAHQAHEGSETDLPSEEPAMQDKEEEQKRRAAERINKLRNLSFNINAADPNNEFETVPAYIRRNLELYSAGANVENFYSNYEVKKGEGNTASISTINTFLDGNKPD